MLALLIKDIIVIDLNNLIKAKPMSSQSRYIKLFEAVSNNPNNLNQSILPQQAIGSGVRAYTQTSPLALVCNESNMFT